MPSGLTTSKWMTVPGIISVDEDQIVRDVSPVLAKVMSTDKGFMNRVGTKGVAKHMKHEWYEDTVGPLYVTGTYVATTNVLTITSPTTTAAVQRVVRRYAIIQPSGYEWSLQFGNEPIYGANTMTVYQGTDAAISSAANFYVTAMPYSDLLDASKDVSTGRTNRYSVCQLFERAVEIEETAKHIDLYAVADEVAYQTANRIEDIKNEMDVSCLNGDAYITSSAAVYNIEEATFSGFRNRVMDYDQDGSNDSDAMVTDAAGATISFDLINNRAWAMFGGGGMRNDSDVRMVVGKQQRFLSELDTNIRRRSDEDRKAGYYNNVVMTDFGYDMPVMVDTNMHDDKIFLCDFKRANFVPLRGDTLRKTARPTKGRYDLWQIHGKYTFELRNADVCHGLIHSLATS